MGYVDFFRQLKANQHRLTRQQLKTLRGQAMSGDYDAARRGLATILMRNDAENRSKAYATQAQSPV